jgi:hypothetical protein
MEPKSAESAQMVVKDFIVLILMGFLQGIPFLKSERERERL